MGSWGLERVLVLTFSFIARSRAPTDLKHGSYCRHEDSEWQQCHARQERKQRQQQRRFKSSSLHWEPQRQSLESRSSEHFQREGDIIHTHDVFESKEERSRQANDAAVVCQVVNAFVSRSRPESEESCGCAPAAVLDAPQAQTGLRLLLWQEETQNVRARAHSDSCGTSLSRCCGTCLDIAATSPAHTTRGPFLAELTTAASGIPCSGLETRTVRSFDASKVAPKQLTLSYLLQLYRMTRYSSRASKGSWKQSTPSSFWLGLLFANW
jgi:hypothetical protein